MGSASEHAPQFSASEVNLLIYHYLKESGFLHTCFALRHEARLDNVPAAHAAVVQPAQLLGYLQRGLLYATAERQVLAQNADQVVPDPLIALHGPDAVKRGLTPGAETRARAENRIDAGAQTHEVEHRSVRDAPSRTPMAIGEAREPAPPHKRSPAPAPAPAREKRAKTEPSLEARPESSSTDKLAKKNKAPTSYTSPDVTVLHGHASEVFVTAWNPAVPGLLASGAGDATVRIWDLHASPMEMPAVCKHLPPTQAKNIAALAWNPDGTLLASGSHDGILRLWTPQGDLHLVMSMHQGPIFAVRWNSQGNLLLTGSGDGTAIVWDVGRGRVRQQFSLHADNVLDVQWLGTAANGMFATCSADNAIHLCKLGEPRALQSFRGHTDEVNSIQFDPSHTLLASASDDGTACIWAVDAPSARAAQDTDARTNAEKGLRFRLRGHTKELYALAWCPTGPNTTHPDRPRMLATASFDHTARIWNADTGECIRVISAHDQSVYALCFSPSGQYLATGGIDARTAITRISDGETLHTYQGGGAVLDIAWHKRASEDTDELALAQADKHVVVLRPHLPP
ncbi:hypothetical protein MVES1_003359 [Malassezia vespertilionis]|nr:uncharacterized protein MVES1_003359 [Malassezia vespertilionis]WFD07990.1 hypothetical protein MVES1_003359 [Malassezia vespertilionis]